MVSIYMFLKRFLNKIHAIYELEHVLLYFKAWFYVNQYLWNTVQTISLLPNNELTIMCTLGLKTTIYRKCAWWDEAGQCIKDVHYASTWATRTNLYIFGCCWPVV